MTSAGSRGPVRPRLGCRFGDDERGQLLILTGVLLVLGFVVIGSTMVQVQTLEQSTTRLERDNLMDSFEDMITKFNQTIRDGAFLGETDIGQFEDFSGRAEKNLRESAIQRGIYLTVERDISPKESIYQRTSRCYAYLAETNGTITSFEKGSRSESVVGAVYNIYASDGRQTISTSYYVKIFDCLLTTTYTFVDSLRTTYGTPSDFANAQAADDSYAAMTIDEKRVIGINGTAYLPYSSSPSSNNWNQPENVALDDDNTAKHSRSVPDNAMNVTFDVTALPAAATVETVTVRVNASHNGLLVDDTLQLRAWYLGVGGTPSVIPVLAAESQWLGVVPHPWGNASWTRSEFENTRFEFSAVTQGAGHDAAAQIDIDYVNATVAYTTNRYDLDMEFEFDRIPDLFQEHYVNATYRMAAQATAGEQFFFQVFNATDSSWRTLHTIQYTTGAWTGFEAQIVDNHEFPSSGRPLFRIIDSSSTDGNVVADADMDTIEFDFIRVRSVFTN